MFNFQQLFDFLHFNANIIQLEDVPNLLMFGNPQLPNTSAEIQSIFVNENSFLIAFLAWTENYVQRLISIKFFANREDYLNMLEETQLEASVDIENLGFEFIYEKTNTTTLSSFYIATI